MEKFDKVKNSEGKILTVKSIVKSFVHVYEEPNKVYHKSNLRPLIDGADFLRNLVQWIDNRDEHLNSGKSTLTLIGEYKEWLKENNL